MHFHLQDSHIKGARLSSFLIHSLCLLWVILFSSLSLCAGSQIHNKQNGVDWDEEESSLPINVSFSKGYDIKSVPGQSSGSGSAVDNLLRGLERQSDLGDAFVSAAEAAIDHAENQLLYATEEELANLSFEDFARQGATAFGANLVGHAAPLEQIWANSDSANHLLKPLLHGAVGGGIGELFGEDFGSAFAGGASSSLVGGLAKELGVDQQLAAQLVSIAGGWADQQAGGSGEFGSLLGGNIFRFNDHGDLTISIRDGNLKYELLVSLMKMFEGRSSEELIQLIDSLPPEQKEFLNIAEQDFKNASKEDLWAILLTKKRNVERQLSTDFALLQSIQKHQDVSNNEVHGYYQKESERIVRGLLDRKVISDDDFNFLQSLSVQESLDALVRAEPHLSANLSSIDRVFLATYKDSPFHSAAINTGQTYTLGNLGAAFDIPPLTLYSTRSGEAAALDAALQNYGTRFQNPFGEIAAEFRDEMFDYGVDPTTPLGAMLGPIFSIHTPTFQQASREAVGYFQLSRQNGDGLIRSFSEASGYGLLDAFGGLKMAESLQGSDLSFHQNGTATFSDTSFSSLGGRILHGATGVLESGGLFTPLEAKSGSWLRQNSGSDLSFAPMRGLGSRGVRNSDHLTDAQWSQISGHIDELGLSADDFLRSTHMSGYSDMLDKVFLGPNVFPAGSGLRGGTVFERLTPRAVVAHEAGHLMTTRAGASFAPGSLMDEVGASLAGRQLPGLSSTERYQLLRDAAERARAQGTNLRSLLGQ